MKYFFAPPNAEQIAVTQNLLNALHSRLASDEIASRQFNPAFAILSESNPSRDLQGKHDLPRNLKTFLQNAPQNLASEYKTELANLINLIEANANRRDFDQNNFDKTRISVISLQKLK